MGSWKDFWAKVNGFLSGRFDDKAIRRVMAAFGSFLMVSLGYLTVLLTTGISTLLDNVILIDVLVGIWIAFVAFVGVFILSFFGTTETLSEEDKAILLAAKAIIEHAKANPIEVLTDAAAGLMSALVDTPEEIPDVPI